MMVTKIFQFGPRKAEIIEFKVGLGLKSMAFYAVVLVYF